MSDSPVSDPKREFLRHALATLAYRGGKAIRNAPADFADFRVGDDSRSAVQILAHIGDLFDWASSIAAGKEAWGKANPMPWEKEAERFYAVLKKLDDYLASGEPVHAPLDKLFQGPVADALTHVGQIAMLRRLAGAPVKGENYFAAGISVGRVGADQVAPGYEF